MTEKQYFKYQCKKKDCDFGCMSEVIMERHAEKHEPKKIIEPTTPIKKEEKYDKHKRRM